MTATNPARQVIADTYSKAFDAAEHQLDRAAKTGSEEPTVTALVGIGMALVALGRVVAIEARP